MLLTKELQKAILSTRKIQPLEKSKLLGVCFRIKTFGALFTPVRLFLMLYSTVMLFPFMKPLHKHP